MTMNNNRCQRVRYLQGSRGAARRLITQNVTSFEAKAPDKNTVYYNGCKKRRFKLASNVGPPPIIDDDGLCSFLDKKQIYTGKVLRKSSGQICTASLRRDSPFAELPIAAASAAASLI